MKKRVILLLMICALMLCGCAEASKAEVTETVTESESVTVEVTTETETETETESAAEAETETEAPPVEVYTVTFDTQGGSEIESQVVERGCKIMEPENPRKNCGCEFDGWYVGDERWSFIGYVVTEDMTLTARWIDCFGMNDAEREILGGFVDTWGYTWRDIVSIERHECSSVNSLGEIVVSESSNRYEFVFRDGVVRNGCIYRKYVEEESYYG